MIYTSQLIILEILMSIPIQYQEHTHFGFSNICPCQENRFLSFGRIISLIEFSTFPKSRYDYFLILDILPLCKPCCSGFYSFIINQN